MTLYKILEKKLYNYASYIQKDLNKVSFLLSFSSGVDSVVMLKILIKLKKKHLFDLGLIHINHNTHNESINMENYSINVSKENNIPIYLKHLYFSSKKNFESIARKKRYKYLEEISQKYFYDIVLTAHHKDDQLETIFMKQLEGGDWTSKIGIREINKNIYRPFLDIYKQDILLYAKNNNLLWINDPTNKDHSFKRNKIRNITLPNALKNDPSLLQKLVNIRKCSIDKMTSAVLKVDSIATSIFISTKGSQFRMDRNMLKILTQEEIKIFFYRHIIKKTYMNFIEKSYGFWSELHRFINKSQSGAKFKLNKIIFLSNRNYIDVIPELEENRIVGKIQLINDAKWLDGMFKVKNINELSINEDRNIFLLPSLNYNNGLYIRQWKNGDKILSSTSGNNILLSDLFINNKLSKHEKNNHPIVTDCNDKILWIPGLLHGKINFNTNSSLKAICWVKR